MTVTAALPDSACCQQTRSEQYMNDAQAMGLAWTGMVEDPLAKACTMPQYRVSALELGGSFRLDDCRSDGLSKPIVATRVGGIPELVSNRESGFLVERGEVAASAERILLLAEQPELRRLMGQAGCRITHEKFALTQNVAQLIHSYTLR